MNTGSSNHSARLRRRWVAVCLVSSLGSAAHAQATAPAQPAAAVAGPPALLRQMVGTWSVEQRIWTGPATSPVQGPPAVPRRRLVGDSFLEEVMELAGPGLDPFTRVSYLNYNTVTQRYESFTIDTRAPQMMYEKGYEDGVRNPAQEPPAVRLFLEDTFVLPRWGTTVNAAFKGRKVIEPAVDRQVVRLYWTPLGGESSAEFLAGEYVYTRQR